jgi:hypothetical protein
MSSNGLAIGDTPRSIALGTVARRTWVASEATGMVEDLGIDLVVVLHVHSLQPWWLLSCGYARAAIALTAD